MNHTTAIQDTQDTTPQIDEAAYLSTLGVSDDDLDRLKRGKRRITLLTEILDNLGGNALTLPPDIRVLVESSEFAFQVRPSTFVLIGASGVGKTKICQFLIKGDDLLPSKSGANSTALPTRLVFDAASQDEQYAELVWETTDEFMTRHEALLKRYNLAGEPLTEKLLNHIRKNIAENCQETTEQFLKIADQHVRHRGGQLPTRLDLTDAAQVEEVKEISSESSNRNRNETTRVVDLVSEVRYHLAPESSVLPSSIEIMDCPGFGGGKAHEARIAEVIEGADAVFIVARASRLTKADMADAVALCERVRAADPNSAPHKKVFILLNQIDDWDRGTTEHVETLASALYDGGDQPDFDGRPWLEISAQTAVYAQISQKNGGLPAEERNLYHGSVVSLAGSAVDLTADSLDELAFEISGGRSLGDRIQQIAVNVLNQRLERGERDLGLAVKAVDRAIEAQISELLPNTSTASDPLMNPTSNENLLLRSKNKAQNHVLAFRRKQLNEMDGLRQRLIEKALPGMVQAVNASIEGFVLQNWDIYGFSANINWRDARVAPMTLDLTFLSSLEREAVKLIVLEAPKLLSTAIEAHFKSALSKANLLASLSKACFDEETAKTQLQETLDDSSYALLNRVASGTLEIVEEIWNQERFHLIQREEGSESPQNASGFGGTKTVLGFGTKNAQNRAAQPPDLTAIVRRMRIQPDASQEEMKKVFQPLLTALSDQYFSPIGAAVVDKYLDRYETGLRTLNSELNLTIDGIHALMRLDEPTLERIRSASATPAEASAAEAHSRLNQLKEAKQELHRMGELT